MTSGRFQQLRNLFDAAAEREPAERASFLDAACQGDVTLRDEVERLLAAHESTTRLIEEAAVTLTLERTDPLSREGSRIGPYEILRKLGQGGMGTVYLARRADEAFQRLVAVKVLRADVANEDLIRRFQREREILAGLDHPNVTRLLDAGTTADQLPYFVMEYVEGVPIHQYCDDAQLPVEERLRLFQQVCDAVAYAHRQGVIHRDLKPGNILVAKGQVKVLDFGIARLMRGEATGDTLTAASLMMMTPQYASPEQVRGEAATRESDVYAMGVILYELLTGHSPYHLRSRVYYEVVRVVCQEPPTRPSTVISTPLDVEVGPQHTTVAPETAGRRRRVSLDEWKQQLSGNLDAVILKALSKQPIDRYRSPEHFKDDLERHLKGEPVWARNAWWGQRAAMTMSRHRAMVTCVTAAIAAVVCGAVKLEAKAIFFVAGAALLFAIWYAATDRELGQKIAGSFLTSRLFVYAVLIAVLLSAIVTRPSGTAPLIPDPVFFGVPVIAMGYMATWFLRRQWAGSLIADFSRQNFRRWAPQIGFVLLTFFGDKKNPAHHESVALSSARLGAALMFFISGRREVRESGILQGGHLIRWSSVRSWHWDEVVSLMPGGWRDQVGAPQQEKECDLNLELHRRIQFLPPAKIRFSASERSAMEPILTRQLGAWPE